MKTKSNNNNETINVQNAQVDNSSMDPRDAIIVALCAKLGVDATALLASVPSEKRIVKSEKCGDDKLTNQVPTEKRGDDKASVVRLKVKKTADVMKMLEENDKAMSEYVQEPLKAKALKVVEIIDNGTTDVLTGWGMVRNELTEPLIHSGIIAPFSGALYKGGRPSDPEARKACERISGYAINKRWSALVRNLVGTLSSVDKKQYGEYIAKYLADHQQTVDAIEKWNALKWRTDKRAKAVKKDLKAVFATIAA